jgi:D-amino-acid dehydrogenase
VQIHSCQRPLLPKVRSPFPFIGRTQAAENLTIAAAHAMIGLSLAPVTCEITARIIDREPPVFDLSHLSPDRFA